MVILLNDEMLEFHPNTVVEVKKLFGLDDDTKLKESLDLLEEWLTKQEHFVKKDFDRNYLERMLISAKGSVETTKGRLDKMCTFKTLLPQYFRDCDLKEEVKDCFGKIELYILPKLDDDNKRYWFCSHYGEHFTVEMLLGLYQMATMMFEYTRAHDYPSSYEVILDYRSCKLTEVLAKVNLLQLRDVLNIAIEGYGYRVSGIHIISDSSLFDLVMTIAKQVVPKKLKDRIHQHKNLESLHQKLQKDILPAEYGGKEGTSHLIYADWVNTLSGESFRSYWRKMTQATTDESKRRADKFNEQYMGMPGSFRSLKVD